MPEEWSSVLIVTPEVAGEATPLRIGSILDALAQQYRRAGKDVTVLLASRELPAPDRMKVWRARCMAVGIDLAVCETRQQLSVPYPLQFSWNVWQWMAGRSFDLVVFCDAGGLGVYPMLAKRTGLDFAATRMVVSLQGPTLWQRSIAREYVEGLIDICADAAERLSVRLADAIISPSDYMIETLERSGWKLPHERFRLSNPTLQTVVESEPASDDEALQDIVILQEPGRSGGLAYVLKALERLPAGVLAGKAVTFVSGSDLGTEGRSKVAAALCAQPLTPAVLDGQSEEQIVGRLATPGVIAVFPALVAHVPPLLELARRAGATCLAADAGAVSEVFGEEVAYFRPQQADLAARLVDILASPTARATFSALDDASGWLKLGRRADPPTVRPIQTSESKDLVSVVLVTRNRPGTLEEALAGLREQTWKHLEVILVDDGSDTEAALEKLNSLEQDFARRDWRIIRQPNSYLGAARNAGWKVARGRYVIFHDDDNISAPDLVQTYVTCMEHSGADIMTAAMAVFSRTHERGPIGEAKTVFAPIGDAASAGFFANIFGDAHACFRKEALEQTGGFTEEFGVGHEDTELFAKSALAGLEILSIPQPLFWYRISPDSMLRTRENSAPDHLRGMQPYFDMAPPILVPTLMLAASMADHGLRETGAVAKCTSEDDLRAFVLATLPRQFRDERVVRQIVERSQPWTNILLRRPLAMREWLAARRIQAVPADLARNLGWFDLLLLTLPDRLGSREAVEAAACFRRSWQEEALRHPAKIAYWQAIRRIQRESRRKMARQG